MPNTGTLTLLNIFIPFLASIRAISCGVEMIIDPLNLELCAKVN